LISNDGSINYHEIFCFLLDLDYLVTHYSVQIRSLSDFIFEILDIDGSGGVSFKEFATWIVSLKGQIDVKTFKAIDIINKDKIEEMEKEHFYEFVLQFVINCK